MNVKGRYCFLLMIWNVNTYAVVILERSLRANEGHIGVNESLLATMIHNERSLDTSECIFSVNAFKFVYKVLSNDFTDEIKCRCKSVQSLITSYISLFCFVSKLHSIPIAAECNFSSLIQTYLFLIHDLQPLIVFNFQPMKIFT